MSRTGRSFPVRARIWRAAPESIDTTPPTIDITIAADRTRISRISGRDASTFSFQVNEVYAAYEVRAVPSDSSPHTTGILIESGGGGSANSDRQVVITDDEIVDAGLGEGDYTIKVFAQDGGGNWSP